MAARATGYLTANDLRDAWLKLLLKDNSEHPLMKIFRESCENNFKFTKEVLEDISAITLQKIIVKIFIEKKTELEKQPIQDIMITKRLKDLDILLHLAIVINDQYLATVPNVNPKPRRVKGKWVFTL